MILLFPDLDTLRLALTSGIVPSRVALAPAAAGFDDRGRVWLRPSVVPARAALADLRRLGVETPRGGAPDLAEYSCWLQVFPLVRAGEQVVPPEGSAVLFDLPGDAWTAVVAEILRLGNERQSFRYFPTAAGGERVLLRVIGPPYYTLLRALDREDGALGPVAYVETGPRLWVQIGHTHPFAAQVGVPEGKLLLLQAPRRWTLLDDAPFREVHEVLDFVLPAAPAAWSDGKLDHHLKVPLRLVPGDPAETDELWVLRDRPLEQLDELVSNADDAMLRGLSFAVAEKDGQTVLVLRVRPARGQPPQPVLDAVRFRSYQKLPNLFVPSGRLLHPPLGRHVLRKLLAEDPAVVTWLYPHGDGTFTPETLPDEAFRPLGDWIDYVLDHDREALQTWVQAAQFDFESFVCPEEGAKSRKQPGAARDRKGRTPGAETADPDAARALPTPAQEEPEVTPFEELPESARAEPSVWERRLRELEERFLSVEGPLDAPGRLALWPEMAQANGALRRGDEAGLCWANALWAAGRPEADAAWKWFQAEAARLPAREEWGSRPWAEAGPGPEVSGAGLDRVLGLAQPASSDVRALGAYVVWAALRRPAPAALVERLAGVRHFLEAHERLHLPVRSAWLTWKALAHLSGEDVLGLARARDRLLERLFQNGLRAELDLPGFLRASGGAAADRFRGFRHWLADLAELGRSWLDRLPKEDDERTAQTPAYSDLLFAFGLAALGEPGAGQRLLQRARAALAGKDEAHAFLLRAYGYRVEEALAGKPHRGPLPAALLRDREQMDAKWHYYIDRLRERSRILEPDEKVQAYQVYFAKSCPLESALADLSRLTGRQEITARVQQLLRDGPDMAREEPPAEGRARVLRAALELAPRVGEEFALEVLGQFGPIYEALAPAEKSGGAGRHVGLLAAGLFAAAHFDRPEHVQPLVGRFQALLSAQQPRSAVQTINDLGWDSFRGLRKLGLRDEIGSLLRQMADLVLVSEAAPNLHALVTKTFDRPAAATASLLGWVESLRALLRVAAGWYYFGLDEQANPVLDAVRGLLFQGTLLTQNRRIDQLHLACDYAAAASYAPVGAVQKRLEDLFRHLEVRDTWKTNSHYALSKLRVIDTVVRFVAADDASLGGEVRRWLDEDEFLVRRRIHSDLRAALAHGETGRAG